MRHLLIKLDVGGFGSSILYPVLKDVPVVKEILPEVQEEFEEVDDEDPESQKGYGGYANIKEAVSYIKELELQIEQLQNNASSSEEYVTELEEEVKRLQTFEDQQVEFERIKDEFYKEVIYADNGPGADEYRKYYESINPELAEELYKQVVKQEEIDASMKEISLGYDFPKSVANKIGVGSLSLKLQGTNLFLLYADKKLNGQDPEFVNAGGVAVPVPKQFTFTLKIGL